MALENVYGNLLAYKELEPGTFQHVDQLTTERRTNYGLRNQWVYTADGELYTRRNLWAITREPQNLILQNIDEAYRQLTGQSNYFPEAKAGRASLEHKDTVVVDLKGLKIVKDNNLRYGHFVVDPKAVKKLNSEQRKAAQRIYGPDEKNFGLNMEMFAEAGITPYVFVLLPDYMQDTLRSNDKEFLGRASWLNSFYYSSVFGASGQDVNDRGALRGVRRVITEGDAPKVADQQPPSEQRGTPVNEAPQEIGQEKPVVVTLERMLELSRPYVADSFWAGWEQTLLKEYKQ